MSALAERLIEARSDKGWKKSDLKREAKIKSSSTLTELENGMRTESPQLPKIAAALGVSVMWLQHDIGPKYANVIEGESRRIDEKFAPILGSTVTVIKPASERDLWMADLNQLAGQLDLARLGMLVKEARQLVAEMPDKQTLESS